ncbi:MULTISPECIES: pyridoxal phosphate-dependent aminotransferase [Clostridium]|uniref:pyridoxal phosphate-dependent aminotransferase n=1 Tax=Clostridium TaxID=1485 RepID=UPI00069E872D|nr:MULTISPECIES: aminotransferase class I/II-fold pyridoxal phosphate-dependent enzyme [Clostridium]KOF55997.1 aspartate aminotransferase [Clostridium sp. DMHC 10]MCD2345415.1 aminotransferase class I/II-fold pyridoxal phosphate-dependent enzyme [Clostridium guangxiense]
MKNSKLSRNVQAIETSGIRKFHNKVPQVKGAISLTLGQPDFPVPPKIKEAIVKALNENKTVYTPNPGIPELRSEISKYLENFNINYSGDEICVTVGGSEGIMSILAAIINSGDKVMVPDPAFPAYLNCAKLYGATIIKYDLVGENFEIDYKQIEDIISKEKPKILVMSYPCNPTGAILDKEGAEKLHKIIKDNDILVVTDEIYSALCYEDNYYSIAQYSDIRDKIILVSGFSKTFSMTGLRIGYICASGEVMEGIMKTHLYAVTCAPSICQYGVYEGLRNCLEDVEYMKNEFKKRRDYIYKALKDIGFEVSLPKGAFYIFPSIKKYNLSSEEFCDRLLREGKVAIIPGSAFGKNGEGFARISYAYSMEELQTSIDRIDKWINKNF